MHGNVLFPTWHRAYLYNLEKLLQSIPGCEDVMLPFWDECSEDSLKNGIPWALTNETFELDGVEIPNPLISYTLQRNIVDHIPIDSVDPTLQPVSYSKPAGYTTVRYPLAGLVGSPADQAATKAHNAQYPDYNQNVRLLNGNIVAWLTSQVVVEGQPVTSGIHREFLECLTMPNYTVFSNTTSAAAWADNNDPNAMPLEQPHNDIHLAVGGFDITGPGGFDASVIEGANGDMGENDTAAFDPIFYFHHCFIDYVFWIWQQRHGETFSLSLIPGYPGTNSVDNQGPTPGVAPNSWLTLDSPLEPFKWEGSGDFMTAREVTHIGALGYSYGKGSLDPFVNPAINPVPPAAAPSQTEAAAKKTVRVRGINRAKIRGSFLISAFAKVDGERRHLGTRGVLSRWHVSGCANCQTHLQASASFALPAALAAAGEDNIEVEVRTRDGLLGGAAVTPAATRAALAGAAEQRPHFQVEIV